MGRAAVVAGLLLFGATPASAHRLDEYLQATTISVQKDRITAQLRLTPGVAVASAVLAGVDADADGVLSPAEQRAYATRVLRDVSLTVDGVRLPLRLLAVRCSDVAELKEGLGAIEIDVDAAVPRGGPERRLTFENRHERRMSVYLVNALVPRDPDLRIAAQHRDERQTTYELDYADVGGAADPLAFVTRSGPEGWLAASALLPLAWLVARLQRRAPGARGEDPAR
ncbi:hypothetical protein tb265_41240 [Gemmatimonadetes bacterium T265]|nr:hypothetical protein tb265_41240 [Gemmatimonadetes bacterium T265]